MKTFLELTPAAFKVFINNAPVITFNFQNPDLTKFEITNFLGITSLSHVNPLDLIMMGGELWVLTPPEQKK